MTQKYHDLNALLQADAGAQQYFDELPGYVREQMQSRAENINSFASLQDYAQNLTRGDH